MTSYTIDPAAITALGQVPQDFLSGGINLLTQLGPVFVSILLAGIAFGMITKMFKGRA